MCDIIVEICFALILKITFGFFATLSVEQLELITDHSLLLIILYFQNIDRHRYRWHISTSGKSRKSHYFPTIKWHSYLL